ncbi:gtpase binding protein rid1 [Moniliophthora roreri MCA 2997]|uniref:Gtpase binding protein rid1 n=2 Tax=Moniliophthora roreri TaxID=221103 RepID=V2XNB8_MONRO|nr:gtpase binding protein rid1 [Moniliophthora roreri MCA 2997]KAI3607488.1 gtpase binding protein rid1 [Moniliophthora roreri]
MFKSILPSSKRIPSSDFTMLTTLADTAPNKENQPGIQSGPPGKVAKPGLIGAKGFPEKRKRDIKGKDQNRDAIEMNQAFDQLLDDLQIPSTLRPKLTGMDSTVKAAMLKSSQGMKLTQQPNISPPPPRTPSRSNALRRTRSIDSMDSPHAFNASQYDLRPPRPAFAAVDSQFSSPDSPSRKASGHSRGISLGSGFFSRSQVNLGYSASTVDLTGGGKLTKDKNANASRNLSPINFVSILSGTSSTTLDVDSVKKLRLMLRNEPASWTKEFIEAGGYSALLTRLNEILEVEWREEQHDDQVLHELLRCFKALSTSSVGCHALRTSSPTPFVQLVMLLYSDKKPGDVPSRQLIIELLLILFDLYPSSSLPAFGNGRDSRREIWETDSPSLGSSNLVTLPAPHKSIFSFVRGLLLTPAPLPAEATAPPLSPHEFIENLHRPRIYKTYLQELSDVCRDYFWVFCHPNNTIWLLNETDEGKVEKPRAPGGMTGGVEFEAMNYFTTHLKFINSIAQAAADMNLANDHDLSAYRLHSDLFLSGFERIILISRKASTTYYPTLHLELARYIVHAGRAGFELPWTLSRLVGLPPAALCKNPPPTSSGRSTPGPGSKRSSRPEATSKKDRYAH